MFVLLILLPHHSILVPLKGKIWQYYTHYKFISSSLFSSLRSYCFPGGSEVTSVCLQCRRHSFDPWVRKIPWRRKWQPTPALLPGESHGGRSLVGYSPWGQKESDTTEPLHSLRELLLTSGLPVGCPRVCPCYLKLWKYCILSFFLDRTGPASQVLWGYKDNAPSCKE